VTRACLVLLVAMGFSFAQTAPQTASATPSVQKASDISAEMAHALLSAKRVYVESFGDDTVSRTLQAMVVDAIGGSKRFIVTENKEKSDLLLKGSTLEKTSQEMHALGAATVVAGASASRNGAVAREMGIADSQASVETVNDARASVRLISKDGDVVWSTTQESKGAKYKGAAADVADKIVKQLMRDLAKLEGAKPPLEK
jgi:hypothetical protein